MRTITRKTNVRRHDRHTKKKVADVRKHQRKVTRQMLGTIPLKDLTYPQAKRRYPFINPNADYDGDKVVNKRDCRPFDETRQDVDNELMERAFNKEGYFTDKITREERDAIEAGYQSVEDFHKAMNEPGFEHHTRTFDTEEEEEDYLEWRARAKRREAEERARKASPLGDYDGDGVCNKDDCHPLDPNRQDDDEKEWRECKKCGYKVYDYPYSICPNCRRDWEEAFKKRDTRR